MLLICLFLIGLIAVAIVAEKAFLAVESTEFTPVPVRVNETAIFKRNYLRR